MANDKYSYSRLEIGMVLASILVVIATIVVVNVDDSRGGQIADSINLSFIIGLVTYVFLKSYSTSKDISELKEKMGEVEPDVKTNTENLSKIKNWIHLIEPTILSDSLSQKISNKDEFNKMLVHIATNNRNVLREMIQGRFIFSSDVFTDFWIPLLKCKNVDYYHSTAIIKSKDYFIGNGLGQMIKMNAYLSTIKPIKLLWFVSQNISADKNLMRDISNHKNAILSNGNKKHIKIMVAKLEDLTPLNKKDFGIAGKLAYAILDQNPREGMEKYILDYNKSNLAEYEKIYENQMESIRVNGEIKI